MVHLAMDNFIPPINLEMGNFIPHINLIFKYSLLPLIMFCDSGGQMADYNTSLSLLLRQEGAYVSNRNDPGGPTKYGVTLRYLRDQNLINGDIDDDGDVDENDIKELTVEDAKKIYRDEFWDKNNLDKIKSQRLANMIFGNCVNMGSVRAIKILQRSINSLSKDKIEEDGHLGEITLHRLNHLSESKLISDYKDNCKKYYMVISAKNKKLLVFIKGWLKRTNSY